MLFFLNLEFPLKLERSRMSAIELKKSVLGYVEHVLSHRSWEVGQEDHWTVSDQLVNRTEGSGDFAINLNVSVLILKC